MMTRKRPNIPEGELYENHVGRYVENPEDLTIGCEVVLREIDSEKPDGSCSCWENGMIIGCKAGKSILVHDKRYSLTDDIWEIYEKV